MSRHLKELAQGPLGGVWFSALLLFLVVVTLAAAAIWAPALPPARPLTITQVPPNSKPSADLPSLTGIQSAQALEFTPPIVNTTGMILLGAAIVLILLYGLMREAAWFNKKERSG